MLTIIISLSDCPRLSDPKDDCPYETTGSSLRGQQPSLLHPASLWPLKLLAAAAVLLLTVPLLSAAAARGRAPGAEGQRPLSSGGGGKAAVRLASVWLAAASALLSVARRTRTEASRSGPSAAVSIAQDVDPSPDEVIVAVAVALRSCCWGLACGASLAVYARSMFMALSVADEFFGLGHGATLLKVRCESGRSPYRLTVPRRAPDRRVWSCPLCSWPRWTSPVPQTLP